MNKTFLAFIFLVCLILPFGTLHAGDYPARPNPPRLVNDFAGVLEPEQTEALERKLVTFNDSTSNQIAIVTIPSTGEIPISDYAFGMAEEWGIGTKKKDNGILLLFAMKDRKVFIATGYGLEGAVPDAVAKRIISNEILPAFKSGNYFQGMDKATTTLMALTHGEYTADEYIRRGPKFPWIPILMVAGIILFVMMYKVKRTREYSVANQIPFWTAWALMNAASQRHTGSWGSFSSGSGGFGGFGGGRSGGSSFGGFGGGSFGGGGAGGSW
jgi:uncharacterized protein